MTYPAIAQENDLKSPFIGFERRLLSENGQDIVRYNRYMGHCLHGLFLFLPLYYISHRKNTRVINKLERWLDIHKSSFGEDIRSKRFDKIGVGM
jgi:hypothetical protein